MIDISIIIVNYNAKKLLKDCLVSVFQKIKGLEFEVWVVDNASADGSVEMVEREFPQVKIIANKENFCFAKANNQAILKSRGKYVFLLNPDTIVADENFRKIVEFMDSHPQAGACGPLVLNLDGTMQRQCKRGQTDFWNSFAYYSGLWKLLPSSKRWAKIFGGYFVTDKPDNEICEVQNLSGAAMMVRQSILDKVGLLSEDYVMYWEDMDWIQRIKKAGYGIYYVPLSKIMHYGGAGGSQIDVLKNLWYFHRGGCMYYDRFLADDSFFLNNWLYYAGIWFAFGIKFTLNFFRKEKVIGSKKPSVKIIK